MVEPIQKNLSDLMARVGLARSEAISAVPPGLLKGDHPVACLHRLAREWGTRSGRADTPAEDDAIPTPMALAQIGDDLALDIQPDSRTIASLRETDLPCVVLLRSGTGVLIKRAGPADDELVCDLAGETRILARAVLESEHAGTVFLVRRKPIDVRDQLGHAPGHTPVERLGLIGRILALTLETHRPAIGLLLLAAGLSNLLMVTLPLFTMAIYDRVVPHLAMETLWALTIGVTIALCVDLALRYVRLRLVDSIGLQTGISVQATLMKRLLGITMAEAPRTPGGITSQIRDLDSIAQSIPQVIVAVAVDTPFLVLVLVLMALIGGPVVFAPMVGLVVLGVIYAVVHIKSRSLMIRATQLQQAQVNQVTETVAALATIKAQTAEGRLLTRWETMADEAAFATHESRVWSAFAGQASYVVAQLIVVAVMVIAVYQIAAGTMSVGALAACTLLVGRGLSPLTQLIALTDKMSHLAAAAQLVDRLLHARTEAGGDGARTDPNAIRGEITLHQVHFTYPDEANPSLSDVSLTIRPGEKIGLVGRVGSGKSTLLSLLMRLCEPTSGTITLDGADLRQYAPRALRRAFGYMQQDTVLFDDTLRTNIGFGLTTPDPAAFETAVSVSGVREFAARHPKGYDLKVGPRGERLSGGERQAVGLARTLVGNPTVLLLDEPTAAMDNTAEARLIRDLKAHVGDRTLIVATHRAAVLALVDRVIWMEGGRVIEDGPRAQVLARLSGQKSA